MIPPKYAERTIKKFENTIDFYAKRIFRPVCDITDVLAMECEEHLRVPPNREDMKPIVANTDWGRQYGCMWLRTSFVVPKEAEGQLLCVIPNLGSFDEILCFNGDCPAGVINSKNDFLGGMHTAFLLSDNAVAGDKYDVSFECYAGHSCVGLHPFDHYGADYSKPVGNYTHKYYGVKLYIFDRLYSDFVYDLSTVLQLARLDESNFAAKKAYEALVAAFPYFIGDPASASEEELRVSCEKVREIIAPVLEKKPGGEITRGQVGVIGHSHMDTAWNWTTKESVRKCARTYSEVLTLMELYPDYQFVQSSALHLDWIKTYYPKMYEKIKARIAEGRYEPNGGVWVECDCNITGGEAMVRQFLYGQRFTMEEFGYKADCFWLPDTFGYNAAIPQIMKGAGVKYFYTTKIDWGDCNRFPYTSFVWRGMDGTEVLTHLNRTQLLPDAESATEVINHMSNKRTDEKRLLAYGFGDGGGGPTFGQLEYLKRVKDLPGVPEVYPTTVSGFMKDLEKDVDKLPVYDGELYLELHRGTLTSMQEIKRNNRLAERALYKMELFNVLSGKETDSRHEELYKILLKNQFHDILPGTCYTRVNEVCIPEMRKMIEDTESITAGFAKEMATEDENCISLYNPLSFARDDAVVLDGKHSIDGHKSQTYTDIDGEEKTAVVVSAPSMQTVILNYGEAKNDAVPFVENGNMLETPFYTVEFDENGYISSLIDKRVEGGREVRNPKGAPLGTFWAGENMPTQWDNWEIEDDIFLKLKQVPTVAARKVISVGTVEYRVRSEYKIGRKSYAIADTIFYADNPRIDFEVKLDWQDRHTVLKAGFDVDIRAAVIKNEIQFGNIDRPVTRNDSYEAVKFEVCNHRWSDVSETRYGTALLNDCKYGLSCNSETGRCDMRLTLAQGGCHPDPVTDYAVHKMTYSLLPHIGGFDADKVVKPAYELNMPYYVCKGNLTVPKLFEVSAPNVICEAVKNSEDIKNTYVLRLYECERNATFCRIELPGAKKLYSANMLEEIIEEIPLVDGAAELKFRPFEIKTLMVER